MENRDAVSSSQPDIGRKFFRTLSAPVVVQWELTDWCNHRCIHCYNFWQKNTNPPDLDDPALINKFETASSEIINSNVFHVTITGGEPLSVFESATPFIKKLNEAGVDLALNTNLTFMTVNYAKKIKDLGIKSVLTSLMSSNTEVADKLAGRKGAQQNTIRGMHIAMNEGFDLSVNMVVSESNLDQIYDTARYVKELGIKSFSATKACVPINNKDFSQEALSRDSFHQMLTSLIKAKNELGLDVNSLEFYPYCAFDTQEELDIFGHHNCNAGKTGCTIGFDNNIRPCSHASQKYGLISENGSFNRAWQNLEPWRTDIFIPNECQECFYRYSCGGGCRSEAFALTHNLQAPDAISDFKKQPLKKQSVPIKQIDDEATFVFVKGLKSRPEDFGGILYKNSAKWLTVDKNLYDLVNKHQLSTFTTLTLAQALGNNTNEIFTTMSLLKEKGLIQERR
ncbi:MAG: radical SAM protein [Candidatus Daviesbacteria bacterium]|nr:radical SAM protein [Candidatus Daviesbacteria bacterium]